MGNWQSWESFVWWDKPDDADQFDIFYTENRESELIDRCNAIDIREALAEFDEADCFPVTHNHCLVGWVSGYAIRQGSKAYAVMEDIERAIDDYPILNEARFSEMEENERWERWESWGRHELSNSLDEMLDYQDIPTEFLDSLYGDCCCDDSIETRFGVEIVEGMLNSADPSSESLYYAIVERTGRCDLLQVELLDLWEAFQEDECCCCFEKVGDKWELVPDLEKFAEYFLTIQQGNVFFNCQGTTNDTTIKGTTMIDLIPNVYVLFAGFAAFVVFSAKIETILFPRTF